MHVRPSLPWATRTGKSYDYHTNAFDSQLAHYGGITGSLARISIPTLVYGQDRHIVQQFVTPQALTVVVSVCVPETLEVSPFHEEVLAACVLRGLVS